MCGVVPKAARPGKIPIGVIHRADGSTELIYGDVMTKYCSKDHYGEHFSTAGNHGKFFYPMNEIVSDSNYNPRDHDMKMHLITPRTMVNGKPDFSHFGSHALVVVSSPLLRFNEHEDGRCWGDGRLLVLGCLDCGDGQENGVEMLDQPTSLSEILATGREYWQYGSTVKMSLLPSGSPLEDYNVRRHLTQRVAVFR